MGEDIKVSVAKGKYTVVIPDVGGLHALRYEEPWLSEHDLCGNNLVYNLAYELHESRSEVDKLKEYIEKLETSLKYMVDNMCQPVCLETREGFATAKKLTDGEVDKYCGGPCKECGSTNVFSCKEGWECENCKAEGLN